MEFFMPYNKFISKEVDFMKAMNIGDIVYFGNYTMASGFVEPLAWKVLEAKEDELLLITRDCIRCEPYFNCKGENVEWKKSTLYESLKDSFMKEAFSPVENLFLNSFEDGEKFTILSRKEIKKYMPEEQMRTAYKTPLADSLAALYRFYQTGREQNTEAPEAAMNEWRSGEKYTCGWWVRGEEENGAWSAVYVGSEGEFRNDTHYNTNGVRPCIRLALGRCLQLEADSEGCLNIVQK